MRADLSAVVRRPPPLFELRRTRGPIRRHHGKATARRSRKGHRKITPRPGALTPLAHAKPSIEAFCAEAGYTICADSPCEAENTFGIAAASVHITRVQSSFRNAWITYRRLRFFVIGLFVTFMLELRYLLFLPGLVFALTFVAYYFSATYLANWKCPRCRQPFFRGSFIRSLFGGKCFYCDLPKWSATESANTLVSPKFPGRR
jgi:hypothetical protein